MFNYQTPGKGTEVHVKVARKIIVDLSATDSEILARLRNHLEVPFSTVVRWAIRYYALHGPVLTGWRKREASLLEGFGELVTGLGIVENVSCEKDESKVVVPPPAARRRRRLKGSNGGRQPSKNVESGISPEQSPRGQSL